MKRTIAGVLVVAILFSTICTEAFAETLRLPGSLIRIEDEAFFGDTSLDVVEIPYGTQSIGSKAFADSSVKVVYIPDTVEFIADDAFSGTANIVIRTPSGSYAETYSEEHDYYCENSISKYSANTLNDVEAMYNDFLDDDMSGLLHFEDTLIQKISTEGIEDTQLISDIEEINYLIDEIDSSKERFSDGCIKLNEELSGFENLAELCTLSYEGNIMNASLGDARFSFNSDEANDLGDDCEIVSYESSEDGVLKMILESNGSQYILQGGNNDFTLSKYSEGGKVNNDENLVFSARFMSRSSGSAPYSQMEASINWIKEHVGEFVDKYNKISTTAKLLYHEAQDQILNTVKLKEEINDKLYYSDDLIVDDNLARTLERRLYNCEIKITTWNKVLKGLNKALAILNKINPVTAFASFTINAYEFSELVALYKHGHPLDYEKADPKTSALVEEMKINLWRAVQGYFSMCILDMFDFVNAMSSALAIMGTITVEGAPAAWLQKLLVGAACVAGRKAVILYFKKFCVETAIGVMAENFKNKTFSLDQLLHESATGNVYDEKTKEPIKNVTVSCNGITTRTDSNGFYRLGLPNGTHTLNFSKKGYKDTSETVNITQGTSAYNSINMQKKSIIRGKVIDATTGSPVIGAVVMFGYYKTTTNKTGAYSFEVVPGTETLSASAEGYTDWKDTATCESNMSKEYNIYLSKKLNVGKYRVVLSWGATPNDLDSHLITPKGAHIYYSNMKEDGAWLDIDDTTSYGPETITFKAGSSGTYNFYIYNFSEGSLSELAYSGATVTVFFEDKTLGTYHVPEGTGYTWDVFNIVDGVYTVINTVR